MLRRSSQRGDTLIEVLFAVTVFSLVVVGALTLMNQGTAAAQRSLEITLVRQQMDAQAEALRFMHDSYVAVHQPGLTFNYGDGVTSPAEEWREMVDGIDIGDREASPLTGTATSCPTPPPGSFIVDTRNVAYVGGSSSLQPAQDFARITYNQSGAFTGSQGLWIEPIRSLPSTDANQANTGYIDFHLRACWPSTGMSIPMTLGTIVRLYEPRG